jgi:chromosome partitioning protein
LISIRKAASRLGSICAARGSGQKLSVLILPHCLAGARRNGSTIGSVDLVVIDAPPHAETEARIAVRAARLVVVPVQPSPLDLWATAETLKMAQDERRRSLVVLNRVPPRSRLTEDIAADLAGAGTPIAATRIGNRVALAQAMALGFGVIENARMTPAAAEISALAEEIRGAISG